MLGGNLSKALANTFGNLLLRLDNLPGEVVGEVGIDLGDGPLGTA